MLDDKKDNKETLSCHFSLPAKEGCLQIMKRQM